jgi:TetR/AcrR family transcriptional regulator
MTRGSSVRADLAARREETLERIREAAIMEFAANGLHGASTQGIADRAGITKTKLHYYISSKEDLYLDALRHIVEVWTDLFHDIDMGDEPERFLRDYIGRRVRHTIDHPEVARLFTSEVIRGAPLLKPLWESSRQAVAAAAKVIDGWIAQGLIRPVDPLLLQFNIWALSHYYALHQTEARFMLGLPEDRPLDADRIADEITDLVLRGLRP